MPWATSLLPLVAMGAIDGREGSRTPLKRGSMDVEQNSKRVPNDGGVLKKPRLQNGSTGVAPAADADLSKSSKVTATSNGTTAATASRPLPPCQPLGNLYLRSGVKNARDPGLGRLAALPDEILMSVFSELSALDLLAVQGVSHAFYAFTRAEGFWKHEYIKASKGKLPGWRGSWRATFLHTLPGGKDAPRLPTDDLAIQDIFSDTLYLPHMAAQYSPLSLVQSPRFADNICKRDGRHMLPDELGKEPRILTGLMDDWAARSGSNAWSLPSLATRFPDVRLQAEAVQVSFAEYKRYHDDCTMEDSPVYLFDPDFVEKTDAARPGQGLGEDFEVPHVFQDDLFQVMGETRPNYRWLIAGPARSGSTFHCDPNATSAWNAVVTGRKLWILFPPGIDPPGIHASADQAEVEAPLSLAEWFTSYYHAAKVEYGPTASNPNKRGKMMEGVCEAGQVFFVPSGWWHLVVNLDDSIAVTQNFVSWSNLDQVLAFLQHRPGQISGFRGQGRCDGDVEDETGSGNIYEQFHTALANLYPERWEDIKRQLAHQHTRADLPTVPVNMWKAIQQQASTNASPALDEGFSFGFALDEDEL